MDSLTVLGTGFFSKLLTARKITAGNVSQMFQAGQYLGKGAFGEVKKVDDWVIKRYIINESFEKKLDRANFAVDRMNEFYTDNDFEAYVLQAKKEVYHVAPYIDITGYLDAVSATGEIQNLIDEYLINNRGIAVWDLGSEGNVFYTIEGSVITDVKIVDFDATFSRKSLSTLRQDSSSYKLYMLIRKKRGCGVESMRPRIWDMIKQYIPEL
jgi:hypothetical protein